MKLGQFEILDTAGWDVEKDLPDYDYHYEKDRVIPSNFACGIKARYEYDGKTYTSKHHRKPLVTLVITTWKGMCVESIHYNGRLEIRLPELEQDGKEGYTVGGFSLPILSNDRINLTQTVEEYQKKRYPHNYQYTRVGQRHPGFLSIKSVEEYGKEFFKTLFGEGWTLKVEKRF